MSDFLRPVAPGQPLQIPAAAWNAALDAARAHMRGRFGAGGPPQFREAVPSLEVLIRNDVGGLSGSGSSGAGGGFYLPAGSVVKIDSPVLSALDQPFAARRIPSFAGTEPAAEDDAIAILSEPIPEGRDGRAVVTGIAVTEVDGTGDFAHPTAGSWQWLTAGTSGPARVLWSDEGTGVRAAIVLLGGGTGAGDPEASACDAKAMFVGLSTSNYLKLEHKESRGRCGCAAGDGPFRVSPNTYLVWNAGESKWVSVGTVQTCCGCGIIDLTVDADGTAYSVDAMPRMRLTSTACGGGQSTQPVKFLCTGVDAEGRFWADFLVYHADFCNGETPSECGDWSRFRITCMGFACPYETTACGSCAEGQIAPVYKVVAAFTGSPYEELAGTYYINASGCGASGQCEPNGVSVVMTLEGDGPTTGTLVISKEGSPPLSVTYDLIENGLGYRAECLNPTGNPLRFENLSSPGGITQIDADAIACEGCENLSDDLPDTLYATVNGHDFAITRTPGTDTWQGNNGVFSYDDAANSAGMILTFDPENCNFSVAVVASFCGPGCAERQYATSLREPLLLEGSCSDVAPCPTTATFSVTDEAPE